MNLKEYIEKENLILPDYSNLNIVDLVSTLYSRYGVDIKNNENIKKLDKIIPNKKHTVLILIDGMGSNLASLLDDNSLLKNNKIDDMLTVSPSSTACVLTSLATAKYPSEHGIIGWYNYNRKFDITYLPLLFIDRKNNKSLSEYNIKSSDIFIKESKLNNLKVKTNVLYHENICNSTYSNYVANNRTAYKSIEDAFDKIIDIISINNETFTYLYISDIDDLEHDNGYNHPKVIEKLTYIDSQIKRLENIKDVTTIITADHGQTNVKNDIIMDFNKYNKYFYAYPGIDYGMVTYYVKKGMEKEFETEFNNNYQNQLFLFKTEEFIDLNIFGPNNNNIISNLGEYISLCNQDSYLVNDVNIEEYVGKTKGNHSGLTKDEMIIPLIVI